MKPGKPPSWGPGSKSAVGTALGDDSCVWFTIAQGCVTETFYPRPDLAHTRRLFLAVTDQKGFFSDERMNTVQTVRMPEPNVPLFEVENRCHHNRYRIAKVIFTDPLRHVLLQRIRFEMRSQNDDLRLWVFLAPAIGNKAYGNDGYINPEGKTLIARRGNFAIALTSSCSFLRAGCFYEGPDDLWTRLKGGQAVEQFPGRADDGNILLGAEIDYRQSHNEFVVALGFGESPAEAAQRAAESVDGRVERLAAIYGEAWRAYERDRGKLRDLSHGRLYQTSVVALKTHQSKKPAGGIVASLAVPWGEIEEEILHFRYQLCWTRDAVQSATALLAIGDGESAKAAWEFLTATQEQDGHWAQNMWLDGQPHWSGIQMDETALPILLADLLWRHHLLQAGDAWATVRRAAAYLVQNGPGTQQDRWENDGGYSPYTLAVEIAALLAAAEFSEAIGGPDTAAYFRTVADFWNDCVEEWTYMGGRYVRLSTPDKNRAGEVRRMIITKDAHCNSPAALALVRFGLRRADDPRILNTIAAIDRELKSETATGPVWHRYPGDRYGEHDDGRPFDGDGKGRGWPLLAGERAHYEVARGNFRKARELARVIERQTNACGFFPEQVWDRHDLPERGLFSGQPSGSAMPLVWAHAEYAKLLRSLNDGKVFDMPPQPVDRYQQKAIHSAYALWRPSHKICSVPQGKILRIDCRRPANVHWTIDGWKTVNCVTTQDSRLGVYFCDVPTAALAPGARVGFTFFWTTDRQWENRAYELPIK